ncbi:MAG: sigma-70 family RNA polymerase sigma factor [Planctomycetota bacterium]|nr:sigma-70 family RNA polymerase sigma factor [Planctomycetota bacterium]
MPESDEQDLEDITRVLAGETDAFARLLERHGEAMARQMRNFSRDPAVIDELTHDVFVEAYLSLANYRKDAPFRHWLARIATITGYRYWKSRERRERQFAFDEERDQPLEKPGPGNPDAAGELLFAMFGELPDSDRLILTLMYIDKIDQKEIARRLDCSKTAAAVRIYRAKQRLKKLGRDDRWRQRVQWMIS